MFWDRFVVGGKQRIATCLLMSRFCSDNALIRAESADMILDWRDHVTTLLDPLISLCFTRFVPTRWLIFQVIASQGLISFPFRRNP